jgi:hypothetical protein
VKVLLVIFFYADRSSERTANIVAFPFFRHLCALRNDIILETILVLLPLTAKTYLLGRGIPSAFSLQFISTRFLDSLSMATIISKLPMVIGMGSILSLWPDNFD